VGRLGLQAGAVGAVQAPVEGKSGLRPQAPGDGDGLFQAVDLVPRGERSQPESAELLIRITAAQSGQIPLLALSGPRCSASFPALNHQPTDDEDETH
jgi:hypothetical protein